MMNSKLFISAPHSLPIDSLANTLQVDASNGLSGEMARKRLEELGPNSYQSQSPKSIWKILWEQFKSPIVYLLAVGIVVSVYFGDYVEAIAILAVILINACIGFFMEFQARRSMKALKEMDKVNTRVRRDGQTKEIPSESLTIGDVILLEAGDVIPADGRLVECNHFQCDESSLTGESLPSEKKTNEIAEDASLGDQYNMVFKGSSVMNGNAKAIVTGIAAHTQLGKITSLVENATETATPLDKKLNELSKKLIWVTVGMTALFAIASLIQGKDWLLIIETSIALAVAAIPEGLPIVATVALAYGMLLMAKRNAIVKRLSSVETLGSTNVILTDKTGTLTENSIYVEAFSFIDERADVRIENGVLKFTTNKIERNKKNLELITVVGALCNNASVETSSEEKEYGDPVEIALLHLLNASGNQANETQAQYRRLAEIPFNSDTKIMGTLHEGSKGQFVAAKGSVEHLLEKCTKLQKKETLGDLSAEDKQKILAQSEEMAANGLRVLAFAYREDTQLAKENFLSELIYLGLIGFLDPPRLDIKEAISSCRNAGIKIVMITGDHPKTALNIARQTGLIDGDEQQVVVGKDLPPSEQLSNEWKQRILSTAVFARTTPKQKLDIADAFQKEGNIVAMTGDGVNDAPALKKADVGIAMGLRGTQVAKETASIVLKDDSFTSIAEAVAHGREIFQNIQKFVIYLISCNLSEIFVVTVLGFIAPSTTLFPLQILFLNMVTDVFPALALGVGKGDETVMQHPPRNPSEGIIVGKDWISVVLFALTITMAVTFAVGYCKWKIGVDDTMANNVAFVTLAFAQLFHVFNMASGTWKGVVNEVTRNKFVWIALLLCTGLLLVVYAWPQMRLVLHLVLLPYEVWIVAIASSLAPLLVIQMGQFIFKGKMGKKIRGIFGAPYS